MSRKTLIDVLGITGSLALDPNGLVLENCREGL